MSYLLLFGQVFLGLAPSSAAVDGPPIVFRDPGAGSGVTFRFDNGSRGRHDLPEIMGGGVALLDADGDGRLDLYFANGGPIESAPRAAGPGGVLYRNRGNGTFVPAATSPPGPPYAMGCAVGDIDGDGRDDLFVSGWRGQALYQNGRDGRFTDVTAAAGLASSRWTTSAAFADLDGDGDLDLYVAAYVEYDPGNAPFVAAPDGRRDYAGPEDFAAEPDHLYRNNGDGTFTDVAAASGVGRPDGRGLGVLITDLVGDALPDIFVANDGSPGFLFENRGGLRFVEVGVAAGVALDGKGGPLAGMGVAFGEIAGVETLIVTNFLDRGTVAFGSVGRRIFGDLSGRLGLTAATRSVNGFGVALGDFDCDGRLDLIQANGHVLDRDRLGVPSKMRTLVLRDDGRRLVDVSPTAGTELARPVLGRGLAVGDLDDDGRLDAVIATLDAGPQILFNTSPRPAGLSVELVARPPSHPSAIGAKVRASVDGRSLVRRVVGGGGYLSASDRRVHLGLGRASVVDHLEVAWPSGRTEFWTAVGGRSVVRIVEGTGRAR